MKFHVNFYVQNRLGVAGFQFAGTNYFVKKIAQRRARAVEVFLCHQVIQSDGENVHSVVACFPTLTRFRFGSVETFGRARNSGVQRRTL